jgi:hypothetical protein
MRAGGADGAVAALAASQHGAFGRWQAASLQISNEAIAARLKNGVWLEPVAGVLVVAAAPPTWRQRLMVATLIRPGRVVVSHRAAAALHRLDGFREGPIDAMVDAPRHPVLPGVKVHRDGAWDPNDHTRVDNIPCTNTARTLCDLGAVVKRDDLVEQALDDALRKGVSEKWIRQTLERVDRPGPSGTARLRRVLARPDRAGRLPDSVFERLIERACRNLPPPVRQHPVHETDGRRVAYLDIAWPEAMLGVEATSVRWHGAPSRERNDKQRDMWLKREGWHIEYPTWEEAVHPAEFVAMIESLYLNRVRVPRRAS